MGAALILTALTACSSSSSEPATPSTSTAAKPIQMKTVVELIGPGNWVADAQRLHCHGIGDFSDVRVGAHVSVSTDDNKTLAVLTLRTGILVSGTACGFDLDGKIPGGQDFYGISIAGRPVSKYAARQMPHPQITIGS